MFYHFCATMKILLLCLWHVNNFVDMNTATFYGRMNLSTTFVCKLNVSDTIPNDGNTNDVENLEKCIRRPCPVGSWDKLFLQVHSKGPANIAWVSTLMHLLLANIT